VTSAWPAQKAAIAPMPAHEVRAHLWERLHSGREIKPNILVINVWKAEGERCWSWSLGSKGWT